MVGQSESLPINIPTRGEFVLLMNLQVWLHVLLREEISNARRRTQCHRFALMAVGN
jgi:hypothetical protein